VCRLCRIRHSRHTFATLVHSRHPNTYFAFYSPSWLCYASGIRNEEQAKWDSGMKWSHSVDRHLKELTVDGTLQKLRTGLYYSPRKFEFGEAPADEHELVKAFLRTDRFVVTSPNAYNQLGLGTTQLYNKRVVYNRKRHGTFLLGNRMVTFERRMNVPRQLSPEFLLVDLVNELGELAEDRDAVLSRVREKAKEMDPKKLSRAVSLYGKYSTQKKFQEILQHAA
jgi:hypothetical protein